MRALLVGGLGAGLLVSSASAQNHQAVPREAIEKAPSERTAADRQAIRDYRRALRGFEGPIRHSDSYRNPHTSKQEGIAATLDFVDNNSPFGVVDVGSVARPAFANIDGDSDIDLFIGDYYGRIFYFENIGNASEAQFAEGQTGAFGIEGVGQYYAAPAFADLDGDGDLDLFVGQGYPGTILFCENTEDVSGVPGFLSCSENSFGLPLTYYARPSFVDLNDDGDLDAFVGSGQYSDFVYYENTGDSSNPAFGSGQTNPFGFTSMPNYATAAWADIDGDGDQDVFIGGGEFDSAVDGDTYFFENDGDATNPSFLAPIANPLGVVNVTDYASPAFTDLDADGDFDILIGELRGLVLYHENEDPTAGPPFTDPTFTPRPLAPFGLAGDGQFASPTLADLDNDNDLDALLGEQFGDFTYVENTGDPSNPAFASVAQTNPFGLSAVGNRTSPVFADIDADGDEDVFVGEAGNVYLFENTWIDGGTTGAGPTFAAASSGPFGLQGFGTSTVPAFIDIDGDLDLDYFAGSGTSVINGILFQENTGDPSNPAFDSTQTNPFGLTGMPNNLTPAFADVDGDGDADMITGSYGGDFIYFENTGDSVSPAFAAGVTNPSELRNLGFNSRTAFADIDADGKPDLFAGVRTGGVLFFQNLTVPDAIDIVRIAPIVLLQGPYDAAGDSMRTAINGDLPLSQPYSGSAFTGTPLDYSGPESVGAMPASVVDWILVQLRTGAPEANPVAAGKAAAQAIAGTRAALLLEDGSVVDVDGSSPVEFDGLSPGPYYLVIYHRNHLGIMSASTLGLSGNSTGYDFTTASTKAYGSSPMGQLEAGVWGMFGGDSSLDGQITTTDFNQWLVDTKAIKTGYLITDYNLDGQVITSDFNLWLTNTKAIRSSKVPPINP